MPPRRQAKGKKEKVDLDLIERILDVSDEGPGLRQVQR